MVHASRNTLNRLVIENHGYGDELLSEVLWNDRFPLLREIDLGDFSELGLFENGRAKDWIITHSQTLSLETLIFADLLPTDKCRITFQGHGSKPKGLLNINTVRTNADLLSEMAWSIPELSHIQCIEVPVTYRFDGEVNPETDFRCFGSLPVDFLSVSQIVFPELKRLSVNFEAYHNE